MASLSQEEENFVRLNLLLTGISPRAVRTLFDSEFAPICLHATLKKEFNKLKDLQKKRVINQSQWNLLNPSFPDVPDSKNFDVTLMILLLRNLTTISPPHGGYDNLPSSSEITPAADLARVKYYRNILAHLDDAKLDSTEFSAAWDDIASAISRLGGQHMNLECDKIKTKTLNQSNREIMLDIKHSNDEIRELKQSVEILKKVSEDTVPWNVRAHITQILEDWKKNDQMYINTNGADYAMKCIKEKSCVTITASSGVGKTATLRHVALQMAEEGYDVLLVNDPGDIVKFYNPKQKTLFVIDDFCGNYSFSQIDMKIWEPVMERLEDILNKHVAKIIVACRLQVYQDKKFESLSLFMSCVCNLLSEQLCLSKTEKRLIAELYLKTKAPKVIDYYDSHDCFPLICKLYHDKSDMDINNFFRNPFSVYEAQIEQLLKKGYYAKYGALALCVMFNNRINEEILTGELDKQTLDVIEHTCEACRLDKGTSRLIFKDELDSLIHTYIKKEQNIYKSIHDKVFDILVFHFGQTIIQCLIKHSHKTLICERFILEKQEDSDQFIIVVPPKFHQLYMERMVNDWSKGIVNEVFCNTNMNIPKFRKRFLRLLNRLDKSYQRKLAHTSDVENLDTALLLSCFDGDSPMIRWCFQHEADCNVYRNDKTTPMEIAVQQGHTEVVKMLLDRGVDYNKCSSAGNSPLMTACRYGYANIVNVLLEKGADFNKRHKTGWFPLMMACEYGHTEIVRMLLDKGADYDKHPWTKFSAIKLASNKGHTEIVMMLLEREAKYYELSPMLYACEYGNTEIVMKLLNKGTEFDECNTTNGWSPVMYACDKGHTEIVRILLDKGADYDKCNTDDSSPLMIACKNGHTEIIRMLLDREVDYDKCNTDGMTPLMCTCKKGHTEIVRMLLDMGADFNICDKHGRSPVMFACKKGHTEIVRMLLEKGADYDKCNKGGMTPLMFACKKGNSEIVRMLLDRGADYDKYNKFGMTPLIIAYGNGYTEKENMLIGIDPYDALLNRFKMMRMLNCHNENKEIVMMLLESGADCDKCNNDESSPLMFACKNGHTEIVRMLLDRGADYDKCNNGQSSPLMFACGNGYTEIVRMLEKREAFTILINQFEIILSMYDCLNENTEIVLMLLESGADYDKCNKDEVSPLMFACNNKHTEIVRMLLDRGADYDKCDNEGCTPLMFACGDGDTENRMMLLNQGTTYAYECRITPLMFACDYENTEIVRMLLERGANYNKCDNNESSPLIYACRSGLTEIVRMLLERGADYNKCDKNESSPLIYACRSGLTEIVRMLLERGADYNKCDKNESSPLIYACRFGLTKIVRMLLERGADYYKCDKNESSPLTYACRFKYTEIVRMLLERGADHKKCASP